MRYHSPHAKYRPPHPRYVPYARYEDSKWWSQPFPMEHSTDSEKLEFGKMMESLYHLNPVKAAQAYNQLYADKHNAKPGYDFEEMPITLADLEGPQVYYGPNNRRVRRPFSYANQWSHSVRDWLAGEYYNKNPEAQVQLLQQFRQALSPNS